MKVEDQFELFLYRAHAMENTRLMRQNFTHGVSLKFDRLQGLRIQTTHPDEDDLRALLTHVRPFVSEKEPVFLNRIYSLCHQSLTSDELRGHLVEARKQWQAALKKGGIQLVVNDKEFTPEFVMDLWINGHFFHNDVDKLRTLRSLAPESVVIAQQQFLNCLSDAIRQILYLKNIITIALKEGKVRLQS